MISAPQMWSLDVRDLRIEGILLPQLSEDAAVGVV